MNLFIGSRRMARHYSSCNACGSSGRMARIHVNDVTGLVGRLHVDICAGCAKDIVEAAAKKRLKTR